jgi:Suppressor of fused protein (SUFU)
VARAENHSLTFDCYHYHLYLYSALVSGGRNSNSTPAQSATVACNKSANIFIMGLFDFIKSKKEEKNTTSFEKYMLHLDKIFQQEPIFYNNESLISGVQPVTSIIYKNIPEEGFITALTYGLSLVDHPEWKYGRAELCICVESPNLDWAEAVGYIANKLRGDCPFCYGDTINFEVPISNDSKMDAFFIFAPSILGKEDYLGIDIGTEYKINIAGIYPMYSEERKVFHEIGLEKFWHHPNFDNYKINRNEILGI